VTHDNVVAIHAVDQSGGYPYPVMQFVPGASLADRLREDGALDLKRVLRIGMQTARGLAAAHVQGLIHRDVKPANILLENGVERVKITDFGLARAIEDPQLTQSGCLIGTPLYMSPEQAEDQRVDQRSDLFSLATVLYEMASGCRPFGGNTHSAVLRAVAAASPRPVRNLNPDVPESLADVIAKLHAREPERRYQTAAEVGDVLEALLADAQQTGGLRPRSRWRRWPRTRLPVLAVLGVLLALATLALLVFAGSRLWHAGRTTRVEATPAAKTGLAVKLNLPADLDRLVPILDEKDNYARGYRMTDHPLMERYSEKGVGFINHYKKGRTTSGYTFGFKDLVLREHATRITGRVESGGPACITIWLADPNRSELCFGVHLRNDGVVEVGRSPFRHPAIVTAPARPCREAMRPQEQGNDLLVIVRKKSLRIFVNNREIGAPIELPDVIERMDVGDGSYNAIPIEAKVIHTDFKVWDLEHPVWKEPPSSQKPSDLKTK
jgi:hypothetical protein